MKKQNLIIYLILVISFINNLFVTNSSYISIYITNTYSLTKFLPNIEIGNILKVIIKYIIYFLFFIEIK